MQERKLVVKNILDSIAAGILAAREPAKAQRRVNPCRKIVDGSCPVWFEGKDRCFKYGKQGCPFWFEGQFSQHMINFYRSNPEALILWLGAGILSDEGVKNY